MSSYPRERNKVSLSAVSVRDVSVIYLPLHRSLNMQSIDQHSVQPDNRRDALPACHQSPSSLRCCSHFPDWPFVEIEQTERVAFSLPRNNGISPQNTTSGGYLGDIPLCSTICIALDFPIEQNKQGLYSWLHTRPAGLFADITAFRILVYMNYW